MKKECRIAGLKIEDDRDGLGIVTGTLIKSKKVPR